MKTNNLTKIQTKIPTLKSDFLNLSTSGSIIVHIAVLKEWDYGICLWPYLRTLLQMAHACVSCLLQLLEVDACVQAACWSGLFGDQHFQNYLIAVKAWGREDHGPNGNIPRHSLIHSRYLHNSNVFLNYHSKPSFFRRQPQVTSNPVTDKRCLQGKL